MIDPMFRLIIKAEHEITEYLDGKIRNNLCLTFPHSAWYFEYQRGWKGALPDWTVVIMDDQDNPVAHCGVIERSITIGDVDYPIFGIQNVYVLPEQRGKGLAHELLWSVDSEAFKRDMAFGLLFCRPHVEKLYYDADWIKIGQPLIYVRNENGQEVVRDFVHDSLFFSPVKITSMPEGIIHFNGPDW